VAGAAALKEPGQLARAIRAVRRRPAPFARASEEPYRRRGKDGIRVAVALVAVVVMARRSTHASSVSLDVFHTFNDLPGGLRPFFQVVYRVGALWAAAVVATAALVARRWRLARDLLIAGVLAWLLARGLGLGLSDGLRHHLGAVVRARSTPGFPNVRLAIVTAVVTTAAPFLTRASRWCGWAAIAVLVPAELYLGVALPRSLGCGLVLGWGVAAAVLFAFGSPAGRPTLAQVTRALAELGHGVHDVELVDPQPRQHMLVRACEGDDAILVKVLGRDQTDSQLVTKLWRSLWFRDSGPTLFLTRRQQVEHEAYVSMLARDSGVRTPGLVVAGTGGASTALLAERNVGGRELAELAEDEVGDELLVDVWSQVHCLHAARISHGALTTSHVRVVGEGDAARAVVVGFDWASAHPSEQARAADVAELLATTSVLVGQDRAVRVAVQVLGAEQLALALPLLQTAALTRSGRHLVQHGPRSDPDHLEVLREVGARVVGCPVPELEQLARVRASSLALALGTLVGFAAMLSSVGDPAVLARSVRHAQPWPLAVAFVLGLATNVGFALALAGSVRQRIALWPNLKLQLAGSFSNVALPFGSQALQVRFLQRSGVDSASAVASGVLTLAGGALAQVALLALSLQLSPQHVQGVSVPTGAVVTLLVGLTAAVLLVSLVTLAVRPLRRRLVPPLVKGWHSTLDLVRSPRKLALLLGGSVLAYLLFGLALFACVVAFGHAPSVLSVLAASVGVQLVAALVPFPGGGAAVSSVGLAGALIAVGVPEASAVGSVLLNQLLIVFLPAVLGWLALRSLVRTQSL
jgi:uncharacterized membrane protein YbhN (UPF0104 family)/tRNA A-37 threonylcarbamoyl transferase component Bud32